MADIRCPMCGRPNPEELDECIFCQARLRPVVAPQQPFNAAEILKTPPPPEKEADPDWLTKIREQKTDSSPAENPFQGFSIEDPSETPDWLKSVRERTQQDGLLKEPPLGVPNLEVEPGSAEVESDWLQNLRGERTLPEEPVSPEKDSPLSGDMPDWLVSSTEAKPRVDPAESSSDWLSNLRSLDEPAATLPPQQSQKPPASPAPDDLGDWMREIREPARPKTEPEPEYPRTTAAQPEPPLRVIPTVFPAEPGSRAPVPRPAASAHKPAGVAPESMDAPASSEPPVEPQGPEWEAGWSPDWLHSMDTKARTDQGDGTPTAQTSAAPGQTDGTSQPAAAAPAPAEGTPDWLTQLGSARSAKPSREEAPSQDAEEWIAPAELPNWVQEMRPVETAAFEPPPESSQEELIEERGPLAGLKGILPSEPMATEIHRPPVYLPRLQINERHQAHSELLSQLIASESQPKAVSRQPAISNQRILRLVIAVLMFAAVLYPIISGDALFPVPSGAPQEVAWSYQMIDSIGQNEAALVVVDYEPAFSGEMEAAGSAMIDHLMSKGARLAFISTNPVGQALADHLLATTTSHQETYMAAYTSGEKLVNLGYLPGGTTGLASLVADPRNAIHYDITGRPAWALPALKGITSLSGFAQIILLTENVDTARAWIEQVGTALSPNSGLVLVTSAQAAPILRAYVDSGQTQGMVAGLTGGAAYEQLRNRPGTANQSWGAYQAGTWAAIVIILVGSLVSVIWPLVQKRTTQEGASV